MNIIITAGGTTEQIDQVRKIANAASGRLASCVAREFVRQGGTKIEKIYYVCERGAIVPELDCLELVTTRGAESVGAAEVRAAGGRVERIALTEDRSTTGLLTRIRRTSD